MKNRTDDHFLTLMAIPDKNEQIYKYVVSVRALKKTACLVALGVLGTLFVGFDYLNLQDKVSENNSLRTENLRLKQEMLDIKNKVEAMEATVERVKDYAKKIQVLSGGADKTADKGLSDKEKRSKLEVLDSPTLKTVKYDHLKAEAQISKVHTWLQEKQMWLLAVPSMLPVRGRISSIFGDRKHPHTQEIRHHAGVDIVATPGTPVKATADGRVVFSGNREGYGKVVVLEHGFGIQTVYAHNSKLTVPLGARVKKGHLIAHVGSTGHSTGPHLHYEVRRNGVPVDPKPFLNRRTLPSF